jgi:quercetin dioxygenase-like cupin family protein
VDAALSPFVFIKEASMELRDLKGATAGLQVGVTVSAAKAGMAQLTPLLRQVVTALPGGGEQEIRVLLAVLQPGDVTPRHTHRFPVTVWVSEGEFTLALDGEAPIAVRAGEALVEPADVPMTGRNNGNVPARMALFYVCTPDVPFADPA